MRMDPRRSDHAHAAVSFVVGAGVMAVELTASRLLAPHFGAGMFVWTSLIVTVLLAMAFGYRFGGRLAAKGAGLRETGYLLAAASFTLIIGLGLLKWFSIGIAGVFLSVSSAAMALFLGSFFTTVAAFAVPVFLLAAASPVVLKSWIGTGDAGEISGRYFAVSTVGSALGTVAPTLWLVPTFGARTTIIAVAACFLIAGLALLPRNRLSLALGASFVAFSAFLTAAGGVAPTDVIAQAESPYQLISVTGTGDRRELRFNEGTGIQSVYDPATPVTGYYYDLFSLVPNLFPPGDGPKRIAIIGLAGGTLARVMDDAAPAGARPELTGVELDPEVVRLAREHFALDATPMRIVEGDGRMFLATAKGSYDVIVADAYSVQLYIPPHMATAEFFALASSRLSPGGVFVMNINAPATDSPLLVALTNTVASRFAEVRVVPVPDSWNYLVFASDSSIALEQAASRLPLHWPSAAAAVAGAYAVTHDSTRPILTDDRAPVEFMTDGMVLRAILGLKKG